MQQSRRRRSFRLFAAVLALSFLACHAAQAKTETFEQIQVEVIGEGRPVLMIPGLNSAGATWADICAALQGDAVQCHIVTLPGFAGQAAAKDADKDAWLADMSGRLLAYVEARRLKQPVVMGHSLGGFLALQMAIAQPAAFERLVIVDALPFLGAVRNPAATADSVKPMAAGMRTQMLTQDEAAYRAGTLNAVKGMAHDPARVETLVAWGNASDRAVTAQAMYELMTLDLRGDLARVRAPTLVLGSWAAYAPYGATKASTLQVFQGQYAKLDGVRIELSDSGYHFLMWDDPQWLQGQVRGFLANARGK